MQIIIGARRDKLHAIGQQIMDAFGKPGEREIIIEVEDVHGEPSEIYFSNEDTEDRDDWGNDLVVVEAM